MTKNIALTLLVIYSVGISLVYYVQRRGFLGLYPYYVDENAIGNARLVLKDFCQGFGRTPGDSMERLNCDLFSDPKISYQEDGSVLVTFRLMTSENGDVTIFLSPDGKYNVSFDLPFKVYGKQFEMSRELERRLERRSCF